MNERSFNTNLLNKRFQARHRVLFVGKTGCSTGPDGVKERFHTMRIRPSIGVFMGRRVVWMTVLIEYYYLLSPQYFLTVSVSLSLLHFRIRVEPAEGARR